MLQYHNKVMWWPVFLLSFLLHCIHPYIIFLVPVIASIFLSKLKCLNKPCHVIWLQSNLVLFINVGDFIKILTFISCLGSNSQSYSVHSCNWFQDDLSPLSFRKFCSYCLIGDYFDFLILVQPCRTEIAEQ